MNSLVILDRATQMLAEVRTVDDAKKIIDLAEAARVYAKQVKLGLEAQNHAAQIKLRAQRRTGEILGEMEKNKGLVLNGKDESGDFRPLQAVRAEPSTYAELDITYRDAHVWQTLAQMDAPVFDKFIADKQEALEEVTTAAVYREAKRFIAQNREDAPQLPTGKYRVIYADPPWKYGDRLIDGYGPAEFHYPPMSIDELCALQVKKLADDNAVLFLWVTSPLLEESFEVVKAWGFAYKTSFVWDKVGHNYGHYNSVRHELLLVCTRGSCTPDVSTLYDSVQAIPKSEVHSEKPEKFREIIDAIYPVGERVELFARREVEGWESWGNERLRTSAA